MTMLLVKVYHRGIGHLHISWDPGLARLHDAARVLEPGPAHMRSPLGTAAPLSRLRRARASYLRFGDYLALAVLARCLISPSYGRGDLLNQPSMDFFELLL